ncbi:Flp pilus assembly complex ATPase component TadA, partial [Candidatus Azambacteria bacterium]|nr:Flp pilus assembly complex ATPase component TadA [Candidatus Azambacteria bacterium]
MEIIDIFHNYLRMAVARKASDAYFIAGQPPVVKVEGVLENIAHEDIDKEHLAEFVFSIIPTQDARERVAQGKELDIIYAFEGSRFRTNIHLQQGMFALSIRVVSSEIPTPQFLNFHPTVYKFAQLKKGLVLLTGSTASGKSSVIASIVNMINHERRAHVITIEDPIEFVYPRKLAVIEQRQIGLDSNSFSDALKAAFRQDPDIIMVGEMRDLETIATALTAAETGHLVFGTVHSASTVEAIER